MKQLLLDALKLGPATPEVLIQRTGMGRATVWRWLGIMRDHENEADREVHVVKWEFPKRGGNLVATYAAGPGPDVECTLVVITGAEKAERHRTKAMKSGAWEHRKALQRARHWADRAEKHRDPMIEALFGPAKRSASSTLEAV